MDQSPTASLADRDAAIVEELLSARGSVLRGNSEDHVIGAIDRALELLTQGGDANGAVHGSNVAPPRSESSESSLQPTGADLPLELVDYGNGVAWLRKVGMA